MPPPPATADGIRALVPREQMTPGARKLRDAYARIPGAPLFRKEFWLMPDTLERWQGEGMPPEAPWEELFQLDPPSVHGLGQLGWCEAAFVPAFEEKLIEDRGDTEVVRDAAGRDVLFFKNRRCGFMPEYIGHPVRDLKSWGDDVKWRLDPAAPGRFAGLDERMAQAKAAAAQGLLISQGLIGGYMYLRSLIGPGDLLFMFYDHPEVIHDCMQAWLQLADAVIAEHQRHVTLDELFLAEDICYNHGSLISPEMINEFLFPYYRQLIAKVRARQLDPQRHLYIQVDTDGFCDPVIPLYREAVGMEMLGPFEVASNCDVVRTGREYPDLILSGGMDKRVLAKGTREIDAMVERIVPAMRARGGYIPTIDHGTPPEVPYANYLHYRRRLVELGG
jgi:uroporphyrinogen decarboxylase